ncbi:MAG: hypothetical protein AAFX56_09365 [Pseudomonadota bacterium]
MQNTLSILLTSTLLLMGSAASADAPLKSSLGLDTDQAREVQLIQKSYRRSFSAKRQEMNRESRKLRRARADNDSAVIAQQEAIVAELQAELRAIRNSENEDIRKLLTPEQNLKFDEVIEQRRAMVGSSRDAGIFKN